MELTEARATACATTLREVIERLKPLVDLSSLSRLITPDAVLSAFITGAPPSICTQRVEHMLTGGLAGLRAFLHLATEAGALNSLGFDPGADDSPVEPFIDRGGKSAFEVMLARHTALFAFEPKQGIGATTWAKAHAHGLAAELELVEQLTQRLGASTDRGVSFWYDPGLHPRDIDENADIATRLGLNVPPRSTADREAFRAAYLKLVAMAEGTPETPSPPTKNSPTDW